MARNFNTTYGHYVPQAIKPTRFEACVTALGLEEGQWEHSEQLRSFVRKHKNYHYVPEWLLLAWGEAVNPVIMDFERREYELNKRKKGAHGQPQ